MRLRPRGSPRSRGYGGALSWFRPRVSHAPGRWLPNCRFRPRGSPCSQGDGGFPMVVAATRVATRPVQFQIQRELRRRGRAEGCVPAWARARRSPQQSLSGCRLAVVGLRAAVGLPFPRVAVCRCRPSGRSRFAVPTGCWLAAVGLRAAVGLPLPIQIQILQRLCLKSSFL